MTQACLQIVKMSCNFYKPANVMSWKIGKKRYNNLLFSQQFT